MDPLTAIGAVASAATLLEIIGKLAKKSHALYGRLRDAPQELDQLKAELLRFNTELEEIARLITQAPNELLLPQIRQVLQTHIQEVQRHLECVETILRKLVILNSPLSLNVRLRWAVKDRQRAGDSLSHIRHARDALFGFMQLIMLNCSIVQHANLESMRRRLAGRMTTVRGLAATAAKKTSTRNDKRENQLTEVWRSGELWQMLGVSSTIVSSKQGGADSYSFAMRMDLPFGWFIGSSALIMNIAIQPFPSGWRLLPGTYIASARTLAEDHTFRIALEGGDLLKVRTMLGDGSGRITDVWEGNLTPLALAIRHGRIDIVRELIDHGADVQATLGVNQTSYLQWALWEKQMDIVRLLLDKGASQDHVNFFGWNTTFFCWPRLRRDQNMLDYLHILAEDSYQDLNVVDTEGWTTLHRVAAYGHAAEVQELIKLGADPLQVALPLRWTAIHHAVFYGNFEAYQALLPHHQDDLLTITDERGWTLLHIAASAKHTDIVRHLLQEGADVEALSRPFASHMPESLFHRKCTPREVAAAQGEHVEAAYMDLVDELGREAFFDAE